MDNMRAYILLAQQGRVSGYAELGDSQEQSPRRRERKTFFKSVDAMVTVKVQVK